MQGEDKIYVLLKFAQLTEKCHLSPNRLSKQATDAVFLTLQFHAILIEDLLRAGYDCLMTRRLQAHIVN